jgi:LysM repeat protein
MSPEPTSTPTKVCPTCGTRLALDATRCLVCGADLGGGEKSAKSAERGVQGSRMPEITLSLPIALLLLAILVGSGALIVFFTLRSTGQVVEPTPTVSPTLTATPTLTPTPVTPTPTNTPEPSPTPLSYTVAQNDTCIGIAATFKVSVQSIVLLNNLPAACDTLSIGQRLLIPQPTATPSPLPSSTLGPAEATEQACEKVTYTVQDNDTLSGISAFYGISMASIRSYNGLTSEVVFSGQTLIIPLCERAPTPGPSPTATPPPPYPAPNLLLPVDGSFFSLADETVSLQWASVGTLRENEVYVVTVVDVTAGTDRRLVEYVTDTKLIVPASFRPTDGAPHAFRWSVAAARQTGTDESGNPVYISAGAASAERVFIWTGGAGGPTPTP